MTSTIDTGLMVAVLIYTGAFMLYGLMEVLGLMPQEIKSAGVSLTGIFGSFYGDLVPI